jgi:hypothetical protein
MPKPSPAKKNARAPLKKKNFTVWLPDDTSDRVKAAVALASKRTGFALTVSTWLQAVVVRAVEEEEKLAGKGWNYVRAAGAGTLAGMWIHLGAPIIVAIVGLVTFSVSKNPDTRSLALGAWVAGLAASLIVGATIRW